MPICRPERPAHASAAEREVWELLRAQLRPQDLLMAGLRITDRAKDQELDVVAGIEGAGVVVVEVKGGQVSHDGDRWVQGVGDRQHVVRPVDQARDGKYALRSFVEADPRWKAAGRGRIRWAHVVALPHTHVPEDFALPEAPRWSVVDRGQLDDLAGSLWDVPTAQESGCRAPDAADLALVAEILRGRGLPQADVVAQAAEREATAEQLTQEQAVVLGAIQVLNRVEVRGGAGSGNTWLAVEQARRLRRSGQRVALLAYSRGLAAYLERHVATLPRREQPSYVGTYHDLGLHWGAATGADVPEYWEHQLPTEMRSLAEALAPGHRFDSIVVDEAQDFADTWWHPLLASFKDEDTGGLYVFSDEGQRVFARFGSPPVPLVPLVLDRNLRSTRQIADTFNPLTPIRMRLAGGDGPEVRAVACRPDEALGHADDAVDALLDEGWRPQDLVVLTTGTRHPEQKERQARGPGHYWDSFWDDDQVFYGHVLGFKGLERRVVVLAVNEEEPADRSRERLYVGLSRARDLLVVCGDPDHVRTVAGDDVARRVFG